MLMGAVFPRVLMVARMRIYVTGRLPGMPMHMPMDMLMSVFVGMDFLPMPVFMAVSMGMLMDMQMLMFGYFCHGSLPPKFGLQYPFYIIKPCPEYSTIFPPRPQTRFMENCPSERCQESPFI
jgi:hypothetical protein